MEKNIESLPADSLALRQKVSRPRKIAAAALLIMIALYLTPVRTLYASFCDVQHQTPQPQEPVFDWNAVKTNPQLDYTTCYGNSGLQCARLELPMDWFNQTTNATISLAVIRQPARVPVTHPQYGGAVLLNPGGPGGSGIGLVLGSGEYARSIIDTNSTDGKYFDIMSFDPRGVGLSQPRVDCFHNPNLDASWQMRLQEEGWFESSDAALGRIWSMSDAKWQSCSRFHADDDSDIKRYVSTASVARDMLEIVERHGEWRHKEAEALLQSTYSRWSRQKPGALSRVPSSIQYVAGKEKILYYGLSYGSYLGGTFAAMFPDRIDRLVVDGVVEYGNYMSGNWSSNLVDTEKTMDLFYFHCARVGYPRCFLASTSGDSSPEDIKSRTDSILKSLYHSPLAVYTPTADVLSYSDVRSLIFGALYAPVATFEPIAYILLAIESKNTTALEPLLRLLHPSACAADNPSLAMSMTRDAQVAIACSDGDDQSYVNRTEFQDFAKELATQSPTSGSIWSTIRLNCIHYTLPAVHRFTGPWEAKTSHPLLLIGNTADPVTPGRYAQKMAEGFKDAVALIQDSGGHCSIAAFSKCTLGYIRQYFQTGDLPPVNTTCPADVLPFGPTPGSSVMIEDEGLAVAAESHQRFADAVLDHGAGSFGGQHWRKIRKAMAVL